MLLISDGRLTNAHYTDIVDAQDLDNLLDAH